MLAIGTALVLVYAGYLLLVFFAQGAAIFPGRFLAADPAAPPGPGVERLWIEPAAGVRVEAWLRTPADASPDQPAPLVVYLHGNYELIDDNVAIAELYASFGAAVLMPEYRGYGRSTGSPGQEALTDDVLAFIDLAGTRPEIDADRLVLHGRSLGGGVAAQVARRRPPNGLVLHSTFSSMAAMLARYGVPPPFCRHPFRTIDVVRRLDAPVLIMHSAEDEVIPVAHARRVHGAARDAEFLEGTGGHNELLCSTGELRAALKRLLERAGALGAGAPDAALDRE